MVELFDRESTPTTGVLNSSLERFVIPLSFSVYLPTHPSIFYLRFSFAPTEFARVESNLSRETNVRLLELIAFERTVIRLSEFPERQQQQQQQQVVV